MGCPDVGWMWRLVLCKFTERKAQYYAACWPPATAARYSPTEVLSPLAIELRATVNKILLITENHDTSASDLFKVRNWCMQEKRNANLQRYLVTPCTVQLGEVNTNDFCPKPGSNLRDARSAKESGIWKHRRRSAAVWTTAVPEDDLIAAGVLGRWHLVLSAAPRVSRRVLIRFNVQEGFPLCLEFV